MAKVARRWLAAAAVLLVAAGVVGFRVLAPAETLDPATGPEPEPTLVSPRRVGALTAMPLIVDGRLRVYAEARRVWADAPVSFHAQTSPYWAYRRWPAQVVGVVAIGGAVVTRWSDGALVALDALRGRVLWRASVEAAGSYVGRRTGASTVYEPLGMFTASDALLVVNGRRVQRLDPHTGAAIWTTGLRECQTASWTGERALVVMDRCGSASVLLMLDAAGGRTLGGWPVPGSGPVSPWGCGPAVSGRSGCALFEAGGSQWRLRGDGSVAREPHAKSGDFAVGDAFVEHRPDAYVSIVDAATGRQRWIMPMSGYVVGADERGVYVVSRRDTLLVYDPLSGDVVRRLPMRDVETGPYTAGQAYLSGPYLAIERLTGRPDESDSRYYYTQTPVLLMAV